MGTSSLADTPNNGFKFELTKQEIQMPFNNLIDSSNLASFSPARPNPINIQLHESNSCNNILFGLGGSPIKSIFDDGPQNPAQLLHLES